MSYYHTYRPQQFNQLLGQDHVRAILTEALKTDRLAHAYLFCGTRGTGKTSTARLLAKAINCIGEMREGVEPCNACEICLAVTQGNCLDVIEIDAASNRGIDEIRQLQEQSRFQPQQAKRKIFIIDEVHMLTKEAFNALLKTLEEPPAHLLFVLATTEAHKLPATIISRCQRFDFQTPDTEVLGQYLERMVTAEKVAVEPSALARIAELAKGAFRDAATILEQLVAAAGGKQLTQEHVSTVLGLPDQTLVDAYLMTLSGQPVSSLYEQLVRYFEQGKSPAAFIDSAFQRLEQFVGRADNGLGRPAEVLATLVKAKSQMRLSPIASLPILTSIASPTTSIASLPTVSTSVAAAPSGASVHKTTDKVSERNEASKAVASSETVAVPVVAEAVTVVAAAVVAQSPETVAVTVAEQVPPTDLPQGELSDKWKQALAKLLENSQSSLVSILRTAQPLGWEQPSLRIGVQFKFHADQLTKQKNRDILEATFAEVLGAPVRLDPEVVPVADMATVAEGMF